MLSFITVKALQLILQCQSFREMMRVAIICKYRVRGGLNTSVFGKWDCNWKITVCTWNLLSWWVRFFRVTLSIRRVIFNWEAKHCTWNLSNWWVHLCNLGLESQEPDFKCVEFMGELFRLISNMCGILINNRFFIFHYPWECKIIWIVQGKQINSSLYRYQLL